ncbi:MAG TPA: hypothetical protein DIW64_05515 [Cellvibrio sp.]|nr:hypothetical protein [Cellvibrio sp.]
MNNVTGSFDHFLTFCRERGVSEKGIEIVLSVISNPPARRVSSNAMKGSISSRFASRKMGMTIQCESRLEQANCYLKEFDSSVIGFWDQPYHQPDLIYFSKKRKVRVQVTMDFFVISDGFIGFEEVKPEEKLQKLIASMPGRYGWNEAVLQYEIYPLTKYLEGTGLLHRVISDTQINAIYIDNLRFLYPYRGNQITEKSKQLIDACTSLLRTVGPMEIRELERNISDANRSAVYSAIAHSYLFTDLQNFSLQEPERLIIAAEPAFANNQRVFYEDASVKQHIALNGNSSEIQELLKRLSIVESVIAGKAIRSATEDAGVNLRTIQRWVAAYKKDGINGLLPKHSDKGNRYSKLPLVVEKLIEDIADKKYRTEQNKSRFHVYQLIKNQCLTLRIPSPSRQAVYSRFDRMDDRHILTVREGTKSAYQVTSYQSLDGATERFSLRKSTRFLQVCHIDHTQMDIELLSIEGVNVGRPWITVIIDEYTGFVLAIYLSFRKPSSISVMCALRLMVKKHGFFPESLVVDGGKEFESIYFEKLCAKYYCSVVSRKSAPRGGAAVERINRTTNTVFLDNLDGNTKLTKFVRRLSRSHDPKKLAKWEALDFINLWNLRSSKKYGFSPEELKNNSLERFGVPDQCKVEYAEAFLTHILLPPKRKSTVLKRNKKIQINRVDYWHSCLRSIPREGVVAEILYDPFDLNYICINYKNEWLRFKATSQQHRQADDLDGAVIAEVVRTCLYINEKEKDEGRMDIAVSVEKMNEAAVDKKLKKDIDEQISSETTKIQLNEICDTVPASKYSAIKGFRTLNWDMKIPDSDGEH